MTQPSFPQETVWAWVMTLLSKVQLEKSLVDQQLMLLNV